MQGSILARLGDGGGGNSPSPCDPPSATTPPRAGRLAGKWKYLLALAALAGLGAWILHDHWHHTPFQWKAFAATFVHLRWQWVALSLVLSLATYYGRALRWAVMLRPLRPDPGVWDIFKATVIGFTAVVLLGRPGEFVRPYLIALKERVPFSSQLAAWFLERLCDLLAVLLVFGFAVSQIRASRASLGPSFAWALKAGGYAVGILSVVCLVLLVMLARFSGVMRRRLVDALGFLPKRHQERAARVVGTFMDGTAATQTQGSAIHLWLYTMLEWTLIVLCFVCLFKGYSETAAFTLQDVLIFIGFVAFGGVVQIPGVGGGVQVVSVVVLTKLYHIPVEVATSMAIMIWVVTFVAVVPTGLLLAFHEGINWRKLKDLENRATCAQSTLGENGATKEPIK
jgi:uncharacterized protein (TIRG00374 family)